MKSGSRHTHPDKRVQLHVSWCCGGRRLPSERPSSQGKEGNSMSPRSTPPVQETCALSQESITSSCWYLSEISPTISQKEETAECNGLYSQQYFYQTKIFPVPHCSLEAKLSTYNLVRIYIDYPMCKVGKCKVTIVLSVFVQTNAGFSLICKFTLAIQLLT